MTEIILYPGKYYVYQWLSENDECLYIGKGTGHRAWDLNGRHQNIKKELGRVQFEKVTMIRVQILLWTEFEEDAFYYEERLTARFKPKWNTHIPNPKKFKHRLKPRRELPWRHLDLSEMTTEELERLDKNCDIYEAQIAGLLSGGKDAL